MTKQEQIEKMAKLIQAEYKQWLDTTGVIPEGTTYYAECLGCAIDCAKALYEAGYRKTPDDIRELIDVLAEGAKLKEKLDACDLITEQEKDIKQLKTECALLDDELRIARQEIINVLNELKEKIFHCLGIENIQQASGLSLLGSLVPYDIVIDKIDELLKEYEK